MRPQDIVILLKILCYGTSGWYSKDLAKDLSLSTAEVSNALQRCATSGLIDIDKKIVRTQALLDFVKHGIQYVFPQRPGSISRGIPTAHSHPFMQTHFSSEQQYVWPDPDGDEKGQSVQPLYPGVIHAVKKDERLYLMLALVDVLRLGRVREKSVALSKLKELLDESPH